MQISRTTVSHKIEDTLWQALHLHTCELLKNGSPAEKRVAKRFAQITCSATKVSCRPRPKAFKKKLFQGVEWRGGWHTAHYTRSPKMDDASIVAVLKDLLQASSLWSRRAKRAQENLVTSKARAFHLVRSQLKIKQRRFYERLQHCRLGIGAARKRTDVCPVCHEWTEKTWKPLAQTMTHGRTMLHAHCSTFWDGWPEAEAYDAQRPSYVESLILHIDRHRLTHDCPAADDADVFKHELETAVLPMVTTIGFHISLKDSLRDFVAQVLVEPPADTTCFIFDYKAADDYDFVTFTVNFDCWILS